MAETKQPTIEDFQKALGTLPQMEEVQPFIQLGNIIPMDFEVHQVRHVQLDITLLETGGILLCVDKIPHAFAPHVEALEIILRTTLRQLMGVKEEKKDEI